VFDFVPDAARLAQIFSQATVPTFFLGAVAGFISLMATRLSAVMERARSLNAISEYDSARVHLKADLERLRRRAHLLNGGIVACLRGGIFATLLLAIIFVTEFLGLKYAYGAGLLFVLATFYLGFALFRFTQEARISLSETDEHH
jgi:Na+/melibiose symporter-like transporter